MPEGQLLIGLTGGIASGKSEVARLLAARGAVVIDADQLSREVVDQGSPGLAAVIERFGDEVVLADGTLDRAALGRIVFADPGARSDLEAIIHPAVRARAAELTAAAPAGSVVVQVIPLLVETGQQGSFDLVVVVDVDPVVQLSRIRRRDGLGSPEARARVKAQAEREQRLAAADFIVSNNGTLAELAGQVDDFWRTEVEPLALGRR